MYIRFLVCCIKGLCSSAQQFVSPLSIPNTRHERVSLNPNLWQFHGPSYLQSTEDPLHFNSALKDRRTDAGQNQNAQPCDFPLEASISRASSPKAASKFLDGYIYMLHWDYFNLSKIALNYPIIEWLLQHLVLFNFWLLQVKTSYLDLYLCDHIYYNSIIYTIAHKGKGKMLCEIYIFVKWITLSLFYPKNK